MNYYVVKAFTFSGKKYNSREEFDATDISAPLLKRLIDTRYISPTPPPLPINAQNMRPNKAKQEALHEKQQKKAESEATAESKDSKQVDSGDKKKKTNGRRRNSKK